MASGRRDTQEVSRAHSPVFPRAEYGGLDTLSKVSDCSRSPGSVSLPVPSPEDHETPQVREEGGQAGTGQHNPLGLTW